MDLLASMKVYRRVVEMRSFSAAANDLGISNAAASKHVAWLEERLGARLLERTTRRLAVTPAGSAYYERCARILDDLDETEQAVGRASTTPKGLLRINAPLAFGQPHLSALFFEFARQWPEIELELSLNDRFIDLVEEGVDVALRVTHELPDSSSLVAQRLAKVKLVLCASPRFLRKHGTPASPAELSRFPCIEYNLSQTRGEWGFESDRGYVRVPVRGNLRANNSVLIRDAALSDLGLAYLPHFYVEAELRTGKLREVLEEVPRPPVYVHAVYPRQKYLSTRVRAFVEFMRKRVARAPWAMRP